MTNRLSSSFGQFVEWLSDKMVVSGITCITMAIASVPLGFAHSVLLYAAAGGMFVIAQFFIIRWMFGTGMKSTKDLGFGSNRQALKYGLFMKGLDWRLGAVAAYGLVASIGLGIAGMGEVVSGAMLLAFTTFGAATQAMRLNRFWPADSNS